MIEDRPLTEFEIDCICEAQSRLQKDKKYMELFREVEKSTKGLSPETLSLIMKNYEYGFFNGEMFALVKMEKIAGIKIEIK